MLGSAYLCKYGYHTLLCEKSYKTCGLVNTFRHGGYALDAGIRAFESSDILLPMLKSLGLDIDFIQNSVLIGIENHWARLSSQDSLKNYTKMFPNSFRKINRVSIRLHKRSKK